MNAWLNGCILPIEKIGIPATDRGFLLGDGVFETFAVDHGKIIFFDAHMARLAEACHLLKLKLPYAIAELEKAIRDLARHNDLCQTRAAFRITVTRGSGPRGLLIPLEYTPQVLITAAESPVHFPSATVQTVSIRRNELNPTSKIKSLCYLDNILAFNEAHENGADDALLLNTQGRVCEATTSNIFFVEDDVLLTPALEEGCLPGIMRARIIETAHQLHIAVRESRVHTVTLQTCQEAFLSNSIARIRTIHKLDDRIMEQDTLSQRLLEALIKSER